MSASPEPSAVPATDDPLRHAAPAVDDVDARRARASIESRLFSGPPSPVRVGRYVVDSRIGAGGMGVVYRAHDPELARDVAVKLMNADTAGSKDTSTARARLVREARAMARLAHPNVIHVYDVGTTDDGVFIAMELVDGCSLARWLEDQAPPWREILRHYVDAGRGLAAAHDAGVIHRDFKPENVLLGDDGRVRVGDFGLAGGPAAIDHTSADSELDRESGDLHGPSGSLTRTGALLGTPKYMAPEQESGAIAGARSDQFSFCVALYEALYGYPPFEGESVAEYRHNVRHGRVLDPPPESRVRGWVHAEIVRGLSVDPSDRHPQLTPLLDRLEEALVDPSVARRRRRRNRGIAVAGGVTVLLAAGVAGLLVLPPGASEPSEPSEPAAVVARDDTEPPRATTPETHELEPIVPIVPEPPPKEHADGDGNELPPDPPEADGGPAGETTDGADPEATTDEGSRRPAPKRKRPAGTCYFQQDKFNFLQRRRRHSRFMTGNDGRCYDCQDQAPDYRRAQLSPSDCSRYYLCVRTGEDQCSG